jgi:hypothetical protein
VNFALYLISLCITALFGAKTLHMAKDSRYDTPVTWGSLLICMVVSLIPVLNIVTSVCVIFVWSERAWKKMNLWKFFNKPIFKQKK